MKRYLRAVTMEEAFESVVEQACEEWQEEGLTEAEFKDSAYDLAYEIDAGEGSDVIRDTERKILRYMAEHGYISESAASNYYVTDDNGIKVKYPDAKLPDRLKNRPYGCVLSRNDTTFLAEADELADEAGFLHIKANRLNRQTGKLSNYTSEFYIGISEDIDGELFDLFIDYPKLMVGTPFEVDWDNFYNIRIVDPMYGESLIKYHQTSK